MKVGSRFGVRYNLRYPAAFYSLGVVVNRTYPFDIGAAEATFIWVTVKAKNCVVAKKFISYNKPAFDFWLFRSMYHAHSHVFEGQREKKWRKLTYRDGIGRG